MGDQGRRTDPALKSRSGIRRRKRRAAARGAPPKSPPYLERKIPWYEFLDKEGLLRIEQQADWLLQEVGIEFRNDRAALETWRAAGADVDGERVRLPAGMARELCGTIPPQFTQHARNPEHNVEIGGRNVVFAPAYGAPFVRDLEGGRRYGTLTDFQDFVKLVGALPHLHHQGGTVVEPCDIAVNKRHLDMIYAHMRHGDKPFLGAITTRAGAEDTIEMTRILFGEDFLEDHCCVMALVNTNSPLMVDKVASEAVRVYCAANQGVIATPFILGGAMGPVTTAAALAQALAEGLAMGAFSQLIRKGAPFVWGNFLSSMDLRSGAPTFGMPEPVMSTYIATQLARRLNIPVRCGGALTAAKTCDAQAAYESADSLHATVLGGANYVLHAAGWLEGGLVMGYEKLLLDHDRLGAMACLLKGVAVDDNGLARDAYAEVEPGTHFLGCAHTLANFETAFYEATLSDSQSFEQWKEKGAKDAESRAHEQRRAILADTEPPPLDPAIDEALRDYIDRKKAAQEDRWY